MLEMTLLIRLLEVPLLGLLISVLVYHWFVAEFLPIATM